MHERELMLYSSARPAGQAQQEQQPLDELAFRTSPDTTLGVELELQIVDRDTGDLVPGALRILDVCAEEKIDGVAGEFLMSMIEVKTGVCRDVTAVRDELFPLLRRVRNIASAMGYDLAVGATHPFSRAATNAVSPDERYQRIRKRQGWLAYQEAIFGLHVHVGVPDGDLAIGLVNLLTPYLPHMLALSANSPFWQGIDTEFASARAAMFRPSPHAGIPQHCTSWDDFRYYCTAMRDGGAMESAKDVYWDIRPRGDLGTIEFRVFDAPATLSTVLALTALTRSLVADGLRLLEDRPDLIAGDRRHLWLAAENKALAARYGLRAECVRRPGRERRLLGDDTARLLERLLPVAEEIGEADFLAPLLPLNQYEPGADRQRRLFRQTGSWDAVIDDMKTRYARELEAWDGAADPRGPRAVPEGRRAESNDERIPVGALAAD